jgi:hypothetical protein
MRAPDQPGHRRADVDDPRQHRRSAVYRQRTPCMSGCEPPASTAAPSFARSIHIL